MRFTAVQALCVQNQAVQLMLLLRSTVYIGYQVAGQCAVRAACCESKLGRSASVQVPFWYQRGSQHEDGFVVWDYHVSMGCPHRCCCTSSCIPACRG